MEVFYVGLIILFIIIFCKIYSSYEKKVNGVKEYFREENKKFYKIAEGYFEVKTNGLKVGTWDRDHKIDFIINRNSTELIEELKNYNEMKIWWYENMPKIKQKSYNFIEVEASQMFLLGNSFRNRTYKEIDNLIEKYNPSNVKFKLRTFTFYEAGETHYNPLLGHMTSDKSLNKNITFYQEITPDELYQRLQFLSQFNFSVTKYQYNCQNQRSLMTKEIRQEVIERDKCICQICGKYCKRSEIEIDHIKPISKGGKTILSNLQVLCIKCNRTKSNKWLETFGEFQNYKKKSLYDEEINEECNYRKAGNNFSNTNHFEKTKDISKEKQEEHEIQGKNNIKWINAESSNIRKFYYNINSKNLYIMFVSGSIYVYYDVNKDIFMGLLSAPSKGVYVRTELIYHKYEKISINDVK